MIPAGAYIIETAQPGLKVLALLLEPLSEDSFLQWGFFNAFFERKEYAEPYVFEPIAKKMLSANDELRHAFEQKVKEDQEFASDAASRLDYIYQRSQYFDKRELIYPVFRLV
jgi:hypothetical protein